MHVKFQPFMRSAEHPLVCLFVWKLTFSPRSDFDENLHVPVSWVVEYESKVRFFEMICTYTYESYLLSLHYIFSSETVNMLNMFLRHIVISHFPSCKNYKIKLNFNFAI